MQFVLIISACWLVSCGRGGPAPEGQDKTQSTDEDYQKAKDAALAQARREYEAKMRNPPPREIPLPNFPTGPGRPPPDEINFYSINPHYAGYLLCSYDFKENHYDPNKEPARFGAALAQIRGTGRDRFPPIRWIAVIICNYAQGVAQHPIGETATAGAIFDASDVFDPSRDISQLVAQAKLDRRPFLYDRSQPTPGEQARWLIVERHAAANPSAPGSN